MTILIIVVVLSKTQSYMSQSCFYQQMAIKNFQDFLAEDLKNQCIRTNIKQKVRLEVQKTSRVIFLNQSLEELRDICVDLFKPG